MRAQIIIKLLLWSTLILLGSNSYSQFQPMGIKIGSYSLEANEAKDITAFCLRASLASPEAGVGYQSIGFGANNAFIVTSKGKFSISEALEKKMIEVTGTSDEFGGRHDRLQFKNNMGENLKLEVTDDLVLTPKDDDYIHTANVLNTFETNDEMWNALASFEKTQKQNDVLKTINANSSNQIFKVTYLNDGASTKYRIENGQKKPVYVGNNFKEIAEAIKTEPNKKQHFILEDFPNSDKETGFLNSIEIANSKNGGSKAIKKFPKNNLNVAHILFEKNPRLNKTYPVEEAYILSDYEYSISADVAINNMAYEVTAEANKKVLLTAWITNIKSFFGVENNNLNDILNNANKIIRRVYPNDNYGVRVDHYNFSFTIRIKQVKNNLAKL